MPTATAITSRQTTATPLADALRDALVVGPPALSGLHDVTPAGRRDRVSALLRIYALHTAPLEALGPAAAHQHHPVVAEVKRRLESDWLSELAVLELPPSMAGSEAVSSMRALAARDRLPAVYRWLAAEASAADLARFLALEGGPDAGFDDLVALCQVGLRGTAKLELGRNFWDEMGDGDLDEVHTTLYESMADALELPHLSWQEQPVEGLERAALGGLLATNRVLQPEFIGALGMTELQAGPRCRLVLQAFDRLGAPETAYRFYRVHADVDPRHGKDWLENAVGPLARDHPDWAPRMVRGALWRHHTNAAFFDAVTAELTASQAA